VPNWKKVIISGSNAELNSIFSTGPITGSFFTGSFVGDGSALTGVTATADPFPFTGSAIISGSLTVTGSVAVTGSIVAIGPITGSAFTGSFVGDGVALTNISGSSLVANVRTVAFELGVSSTEAITTGAKGRKTVPYLGTIIGYKVVSDLSTSTVLDIWKTNAAIPTNSNSIVASAKPTLSSAELVYSTTLTGWTTAVAPGDIFILEVESNNNAKYIALEIDILLT